MKLNILIKHKLYLLFTFLSLTMLNINYIQAQTISVCDNGGFEQDFLHYNGFTSVDFRYGSSSCNPQKDGHNTVFNSTALPTNRRIEIVTSGLDSLVGIPRTRFGSKALRLNHRYGHDTTSDCSGNYGVDRITKQFTVTEETRNFTVWYAVVMENPASHVDEQPFLNIKCDLDPANELCFDADFLNCQQTYQDSICTYYNVDVLSWSCHRFIIPKSEVGNIATLEITMSDCGEGEHQGYAYIDGICEECTERALGSVVLEDVNYCNLDFATICGSYTVPKFCNENWTIKELTVPGYQIYNLTINPASKKFCFDFPISNFGIEECIEINAEVIFTNGIVDAPVQPSNYIEVCKSNYQTYLSFVQVGTCHNNETTINLSDDYYYVLLGIQNTSGSSWTIDRQLSDPYPNETGLNEISSSSGDATVTLGPFRIQEGEWTLILMINDCIYEELIIPPLYCGACQDFNLLQISNVSCDIIPSNTWSFDIKVPGSGQFNLRGPAYPLGINLSKGLIHNVLAGSILPTCQEYKVEILGGCHSFFTVCPPKPCMPSCDIELYVDEVPCEVDFITGAIEYDINLDVNGPTGLYICYSVFGLDANMIIDRGSFPISQLIGTYDEDVYVTIYLCDDQNCAPMNCDITPCFKTFYIPLPDCVIPSQPLLGNNEVELDLLKELKIHPNPVLSNEIIMHSVLPLTRFEIYDAHGNIIISDYFEGKEYMLKLNCHSGLYMIRYKKSDGKYSFINMIIL